MVHSSIAKFSNLTEDRSIHKAEAAKHFLEYRMGMKGFVVPSTMSLKLFIWEGKPFHVLCLHTDPGRIDHES